MHVTLNAITGEVSKTQKKLKLSDPFDREKFSQIQGLHTKVQVQSTKTWSDTNVASFSYKNLVIQTQENTHPSLRNQFSSSGLILSLTIRTNSVFFSLNDWNWPLRMFWTQVFSNLDPNVNQPKVCAMAPKVHDMSVCYAHNYTSGGSLRSPSATTTTTYNYT